MSHFVLHAWRREPLMRRLPANSLRARWVPASRLPVAARRLAEAELERARCAPGWNPKVVRLRRSLHMIDVCADGQTGALHSVRVVLLQDHPFLDILDGLGNAPRAVKSLYRKDVRLAHARALEWWATGEAWERAVESWKTYLEARA